MFDERVFDEKSSIAFFMFVPWDKLIFTNIGHMTCNNIQLPDRVECTSV